MTSRGLQQMTQPTLLSPADIRARINADQCGQAIARQLVSQLVALVQHAPPPTTTAAYTLREGYIGGITSAAEALGVLDEFDKFIIEAEQEGYL